MVVFALLNELISKSNNLVIITSCELEEVYFIFEVSVYGPSLGTKRIIVLGSSGLSLVVGERLLFDAWISTVPSKCV